MRRTTGSALAHLRQPVGATSSICSATLVPHHGVSSCGGLLASRMPRGGPFALRRAGMATSADDLLKLFKEAVTNKGAAGAATTASAPTVETSSAPSSAAKSSSSSAPAGHWAKKLADQLGGDVAATGERTTPALEATAMARQSRKTTEHREALYVPVAGMSTLGEQTVPQRSGHRQRLLRTDTVPEMDDDYDDDYYDERSRAVRRALQESVQEQSLSLGDDSNETEGDEVNAEVWDFVAAEVNAWGKKLERILTPHTHVLNKHRKTRRMRREKYRAFLARCIALRQAKKAKQGKKKGQAKAWQWPKERDLLYNTDLYVPLNLQLKGIPEEGEDLQGLLTKTMEEAARAMGHNPSWPLEDKRKFMLMLKNFFEKTVREPLPPYNIFIDQRYVMNDDFLLSGGGSGDQTK